MAGARNLATGGGVSLAETTVCHRCQHTFISLTRPFPVPYVCLPCRTEGGEATRAEWLATHSHCRNGHRLTETTMEIDARGRHVCRTCHKEGSKKWLGRNPELKSLYDKAYKLRKRREREARRDAPE